MVPDIIPLEASIALAWISQTTWIDKFQYKHPYNVIMHLHRQKIGKEKSTLPTNYSISRQARLWINKDN
jgi:hypothetical protein